jgi:branched-chain amino acid transport system ATP-binding protein
VLSVEDLTTGYGEAVVLEGVSFRAREGEVTCILGPNGVGKTTLLRTVMGLVPARRGRILFRGEPVHGQTTHAIVRRGMTMIPEGRRL